MTVLQLNGLLEDRLGPVNKLEPMTGRRRGEQVAAHLGEKMARHLDPGGLRERRSAHPAGDAADALCVGHDVVAGASRERLRHLLRTHEVLADLNRGLYFPSYQITA